MAIVSSSSKCTDNISKNSLAREQPTYRDVDPSDELYQHYGKLKREHEKFSMPGIIHIQNNGEEYQSIELIEFMEENELEQEELYKALIASVLI